MMVFSCFTFSVTTPSDRTDQGHHSVYPETDTNDHLRSVIESTIYGGLVWPASGPSPAG
jgi:hypothetical protein